MDVDEAMTRIDAEVEQRVPVPNPGSIGEALLLLRDEVRRLRAELATKSPRMRQNGAYTYWQYGEADHAEVVANAAELKRLRDEVLRLGESPAKSYYKHAFESVNSILARVEALRVAFVGGPGNPDGEGPSGGDVEKFFADLEAALKEP
jgi:hypothetical protein